MKITDVSSSGSRIALLALCWAVCLVFTKPASAAPGVVPTVVPAGGFAIDGRVLANTPTNGVGDWVAMTNLFPGAGGGVLASNGTPLNAATTFHFVDPYGGGNTDTIMLTGNANTDPNAWTWGTGSAQGKEDMNNGLVHIARDAANHGWVIVSADHTGSGNADMYLYFLQRLLTRNANGTFTSSGPHAGFTMNDLRVTMNFVGDTFGVEQWQTNTSGGYRWVNVTASLPAGRVFTAANPVNTYVPYGAFGSTNYPTGNFVEAAADFTALIGNINPCASAGFSNVFMVTLHPNGSMSDLIGPIPAVLNVGLSADAGPDQTECNAANTLFLLDGQVGVGGNPALSTNWSVVSGAATILSPASLTTGVFVPSTAAGTNVTLRLTITSACSNKTDDVVLTVAPQASACSVTGTTTVCPATTNVYSAPAGWTSYVWTISGNGAISGAADQQTVTVVAGNGCNQNFILNLGTTNICSTSCSLNVLVNDTNPPGITCPGNLVFNTDPSQCSRSNVFYSVNFSDSCSAATLTQTAGLASGSTFPKGVTTNTFVTTDACGNSSACSFTVTVNDTELPVITCSTNIIALAAADTCAKAVTYKITISDNCGTVDPTNVFSFPASGSVFPVGTTTVTNIAVDASGNSNICTFTVTVLDNQPPAITCPSNVIVAADNGSCIATGVILGAPIASDNCGIVTVTSNAPSSYPLGTNTVIWTAVDSHGNTNTCAQLIIVRDTQAPTITCPGNLAFSTDPGQCSHSNVTYTVTYADNCSATLTQTAGLPGGATFPKGVTTNVFVVTDTSGNSNSCAFTVTVSDTEPPTITCPANVTVSADTNSCSATGVVLGTPVTSDNCAVASVTSNAPSVFPPGTNTVIWIVTDTSGNTNSCPQLVIVRDTQPPTINCPASNLVVNAATGSCGSNVAFTVTATDNCGALASLTSIPPSGFAFPVGVTTVTNIAVDTSGNSNTCIFTVTVLDTQPPVITCPSSNLIVNAAPGACSSNVVFTVTAADNCGVIASLTSVPPSGAVFPVGVTIVTNTAVDTSGNSNICTFTVTVLDTQAPAITCPDDLSFTTDPGQCSRSNVTYSVTFSDNCSATLAQTTGLTNGATFPKGVTTNRFVVTDGSGNTNTCFFTVTVTDSEPPAISCPTIVTVNASNGVCFATGVNLGTPVTGDNCAVATVTSNAPANYPLGTNTVLWFVTDTSGNTNSCAQLVIVVDTQAPIITCPASNIIVNAAAGLCSSNVAFNVTATDNCGALASLVSTPPSGSTFPLGTTTVTNIATDASGNVSSCTFTVTVLDNQLPVINCPSNIVVTAAAGLCSSNVTFNVTATDNCGVITSLTSVPASGAAFPVGVTTVTSTAVDSHGNTNLCTFTVTVLDNQPPAITCPGNLAFSADPGQCSHSNVTYSVTFSDNCSATLAQITGLTNGATFPKGVTTNVFVVTDASGNSNTCSFTVTVSDTEPPAITCPPDFSVDANSSGGWMPGSFGAPVATDNCAVASVTSNAPAVLPVGTNIVTWTATDTSGNTNSCPQRVIVIALPPTILCAADVTVFADNSCAATNVNLGTPAVSNSCGTFTLTNNAPATFPLGTNIVIWTVTNTCGKSASCQQLVIVVDGQPPAISCPGNQTLPTDPGQCSRSNVTYSVTFGDNCSGATLVQTTGLPSGATFPHGVTTNRFTATDAAGNSNSCAFTVTIVDTEPPAITCPTNVIVSANTNSCAATGVVLDTPATGDNCAVAGVSSNAPSSFPLGTNTVTWIVTDTSGNTNSCEQLVIVRDTQAPVISCSGNQTFTTDPGQCSHSNVTYTVTFSDNCSGASLAQTAGLPSGATFPKGVTTNRFTVTDGSGNSNTCSFTVTVTDNEAPAITCPADVIVAADTNSCFATGVSLGTPVATDNCVVAVVTNNAPSVYPLGTNIVTWTASDTSGNLAICLQKVIVRDTQAPTITCPPDVTVSANLNVCFATGVSLGAPVTADNCAVAGTANNAPSSYPLGTNIVIWTVTDTSGNTNSCAQRVIVRDTQAPGLTCPADLTLATDPGQCSRSNVTFTVTFSDNCSGATLAQTAGLASGATFVKGVTTNRFTATDAAGNSNSCAFTVTIVDSEPPVITCPADILVAADNNSCAATGVILGSPVLTADNCAIAGVTSNALASYPLGTNTIIWTVTDTSGNTNTCAQRVIVRDTQPPAITCPGDLTFTTDPGHCSRSNVTYTVTFSDNCSGATLAQTLGLASGATFVKGVTTNRFTVTDAAGNSNSCSFTVTIVDNEAPSIVCPADVIVSADTNACAATGVSLGTPVATDNCAVGSVTSNAPASYPSGTNTVTWTVTDASGNTNSCQQKVIVRDTQPPAITCPGNLTFTTNPGHCSRSNVTYSVTFTDNCSGATLTQTTGLASGATFSKGVTTNRFTATDAAGNTNTCFFTVTVTDNEAPTITCPATISVDTAPGGNAVTNLFLGVPVTTDNCAVAAVTNNAPVVLPVGTNVVTWIVADTSGNFNTCAQTVVVVRACSDDLSATALTNVTLCASYAAVFTTVAASQFPIAYTWKFNGQALPGYTNNSLLLPVVDVTNGGVYTVEIHTACATNIRSATLTVLPLPATNPMPYTNAAGIVINTFSVATPYGSIISPQCVTNVVKKVTVELHGLTHSFPADASMLLMSPDGRAVMLMAGAGGGEAVLSPGVDILFTDTASAVPPNGSLLTNGVYHPSNYRPGLTLPAPVPGRPYSTNLATFIGAEANGPWRLFVYDDSPGDGGYIVSWKLNLEWQTGGDLLLQNPKLLGNGSFQAEVLVAPGIPNIVLCTTNLIQWTPLQTNTFLVYPGVFTDPESPLFPNRFYRAILKP